MRVDRLGRDRRGQALFFPRPHAILVILTIIGVALEGTMDTVSIVEAKAQFSQLVDRATRGASVIILRHGKPVARLVPIETPALPRIGALKGVVKAPTGIEKPFTTAELKRLFGIAR